MNNLSDKNIGILCGGWSDERTVSLNSGKSAYESLISNNLHAYLLDYQKDDIDILSLNCLSGFWYLIFVRLPTFNSVII